MVRAWLKDHDWHVVPISLRWDEGAPMLESWVRKEVLPDFDIAKTGKRRWCEVKTKSSTPFYAKGKRKQTGNEADKIEAYLKVQEVTGTEVWMAFIQLDIKKLLFGPLNELMVTHQPFQPTIATPSNPEKKFMYYFDINRFQEWYDLSEGYVLPDRMERKTWQPWENPEGLKSAAKQLPLF